MYLFEYFIFFPASPFFHLASPTFLRFPHPPLSFSQHCESLDLSGLLNTLYFKSVLQLQTRLNGWDKNKMSSYNGYRYRTMDVVRQQDFTYIVRIKWNHSSQLNSGGWRAKILGWCLFSFTAHFSLIIAKPLGLQFKLYEGFIYGVSSIKEEQKTVQVAVVLKELSFALSTTKYYGIIFLNHFVYV